MFVIVGLIVGIREDFMAQITVLTMLWVRKEILLIINETHSGIIIIYREAVYD